MTERIHLTRDLLVKCWMTAKNRNAIKLAHTDQRVSSRPGFEIHFDGLRAEVALAQYAEQPWLVDFSVQMHGDGGNDMELYGWTVQVKASIYEPPLLRFNIHGSQTFNADVAVLAYVPLTPKQTDQQWCQRDGYVDLIGWITREEFMDCATVTDFGYGDRYVVEPESLHTMPTMRRTVLPVGIVCAQCGGGEDTNPSTDAPTIPFSGVLLHPQCLPFYDGSRARWLK